MVKLSCQKNVVLVHLGCVLFGFSIAMTSICIQKKRKQKQQQQQRKTKQTI